MDELKVVKTEEQVTLTELEARDRATLIQCYISTMLNTVYENLENLEVHLPSDQGAIPALTDAYNSVAVAQEYMKELGKLEDRPIA